MKAILSGTMSINMFLEFLHRNNHTDKLIMKNIKVLKISKRKERKKERRVYSMLTFP